jgi:hypothetical protein
MHRMMVVDVATWRLLHRSTTGTQVQHRRIAEGLKAHLIEVSGLVRDSCHAYARPAACLPFKHVVYVGWGEKSLLRAALHAV